MPKVLFITNAFDAGISEGLSHFLSIIRRAIVHYEYFKIAVSLTKHGINAFRQQMGELIAGDDKTDGGTGNHKPFYFLSRTWQLPHVENEFPAIKGLSATG